jgi:hypothetical protein
MYFYILALIQYLSLFTSLLLPLPQFRFKPVGAFGPEGGDRTYSISP